MTKTTTPAKRGRPTKEEAARRDSVKLMRSIMEKNDWTVERFAEEIGVTTRTIYRYLSSGKVPLPISKTILALLKVSAR